MSTLPRLRLVAVALLGDGWLGSQAWNVSDGTMVAPAIHRLNAIGVDTLLARQRHGLSIFI